MTLDVPLRLTQYAAGGGCACKVPPGELERVLAGISAMGAGGATTCWSGLENGDDGAVVRIDGDRAVVVTADFFTPGRRRPLRLGADRRGQRAVGRLRHGRRAAGRGEPAVLAARPSAVRARRRGAPRRCRRGLPRRAATWPVGTASTTRSRSTAWPSPASPTRTGCCATTPARPGTPLTLTKPLGLGVLNNRHKATGEVFAEAVATMTTLNRDASRAALGRGHRLRHRRHRVRAARAPAASSAAPAASAP